MGTKSCVVCGKKAGAQRASGEPLCSRCAFIEDLVGWQKRGKMLAYVDDKRGTVISWPGTIIGVVVRSHSADHNWDWHWRVKGQTQIQRAQIQRVRLRRYVQVRLITGEVCWGWHWLNGDYARLYRYKHEPKVEAAEKSRFLKALWDSYQISSYSPLAQEVLGLILRGKIEGEGRVR